jgi:hypothetical protein
MRRRTLIRNVVTWISFQHSRLNGQTPKFPDEYQPALMELAATVLPESLGREKTDAVALQFVRWVQEYRASAEMQTGYGTTRVRYKPASPAPRYLDQLKQLASGPLAQNDLGARRAKIAETLRSARILDLPMVPDGGHIAVDLMAFYFQSPVANDLAYEAEIGKDQCRTLKNSGSIPASLKKDTTHAAL